MSVHTVKAVSTSANHHHFCRCLALPSFPHLSFAAPVSESQMKRVALVWNPPHLIVDKGNDIVTMEIVIN